MTIEGNRRQPLENRNKLHRNDRIVMHRCSNGNTATNTTWVFITRITNDKLNVGAKTAIERHSFKRKIRKKFDRVLT